MRRCSLTIAVRSAGVIALAVAALNEAKAQQGLPASPQNAGASPAVENNGQDFTRPDLFQLRYFYQTAPGSGAVPSTMRTVTRDAVILRSPWISAGRSRRRGHHVRVLSGL